MARARSLEKRDAIFQAAVEEIAEVGLVAATARIAKRAGVAAGTLFTYFESKEELFNELYLVLKAEVYTRVELDFPHKATLERRARHIWISYLDWALESMEKRKVSVQLNVSDVITAATRTRAAEGRGTIDATFKELRGMEAAHRLPAGFAAAAMMAMQEATMEFIAKQPKQREELIERGFKAFWRALS